MKRLIITASGEVQRVGYRDRVTKIAKKNNITGIVRNCPGYDVEIIAEGNEADLDQFISQIKIIEEPICVESIKIESGTYDGKWKYFEIQRGNPDEELGERLDAALTYLVRIDSNSRRSVEIGEQMLGKQDQLLGKQDQMLDKQDQMLTKQEQMLGKQEQQISLQKVTNLEIQEMRTDLKDSLYTKYQSIEQQLHEIQTILKNAGMMS